MRRPLFLLTLVLYAWSAMEMHEWARVPQVLVHLLQHHSDLGHHDEDVEGHHHADIPAHEHDHTPFDDGCNDEFCACGGAVALAPAYDALMISVPSAGTELFLTDVEARVASFQGSKWNPPKLG